MEIQFRVWDGEKMWYPQQRERTFAIGQQGEVVSMERTTIERLEYLLEKDENFVATLSTGLKDKNGKEIWEGDILRAKHNDYSFACEVSWIESMASFVMSSEKGQVHKGGGNWLDIEYEMIGNIYENPELLKGVA